MYRIIFILVSICVSPAMAQTLQVRVVTTGNSSSATVGNNTTVPVFVQAQLSGQPSAGLALIGFNLTATGSLSFDLCDQTRFLLSAPTSPVDIKSHFDRNAGLTNPPGGPVSGFSGTCDGAGGLLQIGGAQNTIANPGAPVSYPSGTVLTGVGNSGYVTIAAGTLTTPAAGNGAIILSANTVFAAALNPGQVGPAYSVAVIAPENVVITGSLVITGCGGPCASADVNMDGQVNGSDILSVRAPGAWNTAINSSNYRADVNHDGFINASDILSIRAPGTWNTTTGPCCSTVP